LTHRSHRSCPRRRGKVPSCRRRSPARSCSPRSASPMRKGRRPPYQLLVDDGAESISSAENRPPGMATPLRSFATAPCCRRSRVLVYAAGALGYELVTLTPPRPASEWGWRCTAAGEGDRKAMAERQRRFKNLTEMARAIEAIHGRPSKEEEQLILAGVAASTPLPPRRSSPSWSWRRPQRRRRRRLAGRRESTRDPPYSRRSGTLSKARPSRRSRRRRQPRSVHGAAGA